MHIHTLCFRCQVHKAHRMRKKEKDSASAYKKTRSEPMLRHKQMFASLVFLSLWLARLTSASLSCSHPHFCCLYLL